MKKWIFNLTAFSLLLATNILTLAGASDSFTQNILETLDKDKDEENKNNLKENSVTNSIVDDVHPLIRYEIISKSEILKLIEKDGDGSLLGKGAEASVFKVKLKQTGTPCALIIRSVSVNENKKNETVTGRKEFITRMLANQKINPHQAKIYGYFWAQDKDESNKLYECLLLELGIISKDEVENKFEPLYYYIFRTLNTYSLYKAGISELDVKPRNYIIVKSDEEYDGKKMSSYNYWKYRVTDGEEDVDIYIPKQAYILKRIDYAGWGVFSPSNISFSTLLENKKKIDMEFNKLDKEKIEDLFKKPKNVSEDKILTIDLRGK